MENNQNTQKEGFTYTYSARQQEELKAIRKKYLLRSEDKMEQLRRLDARVTSKGTVAAMIVGLISALILGLGMSCCMVWAESLFIPGIVMGIAGLAGAALAYPVYHHIVRKEREKAAPEILRLTEELMK